MNQLDPRARWLYRCLALPKFSVGLLLFVAASFAFTPYLQKLPPKTTAFTLAAIALLVSVLLTEIYTRLTYRNFKFSFDTDVIKIEQGIIWKKYTSIPYERIQNIEIKRGILARILGFSSIDMETAGNTNYQQRRYKSEGHIPAIAEEQTRKIRDYIMQRIKNKKGTGL